MAKTLAQIEAKLNEALQELSDYKKSHRQTPVIGGTVEIAGMEWTILDKTDGGYLAITKDSIGDKVFSKKNNNWQTSSLREFLNKEFLKKIVDDIGEGNLVEFERDLMAVDGQTEYGVCKDVVSMLTEHEYQKYRKFLPNIDKYWWLISPWSTPCNGYEKSVAVVCPSGDFNYYVCNSDCGVRPVCIFSSSIFESN